MTVKYSVVMPIYLNKEEHKTVINETLNSVLEGSSDYELIIVDDGSSIDPSYLQKYADVYIKHKTNKGVAPSWNDGIKIARGQYIVVINDDIVVPNNWLEDIVLCYKDEKCGVGAPRVEHLPDPISGISEKTTWYAGSCFMLSADLIKEIGLFDERFIPFNCEDVDYWHRLKQKGYKLMRNFDVFVSHKEGQTVHSLSYTDTTNANVERLIDKWGFDIRSLYYD